MRLAGTAVAANPYVYFGDVAPHTLPDLVLQVGPETMGFAAVISPAGDIDHDGYADIAVMAQGLWVGLTVGPPSRPGKAYLYSGGPNAGQSTIATVTPGPTMWGFTVLDIDGDADPELLIGQTVRRQGAIAVLSPAPSHALDRSTGH